MVGTKAHSYSAQSKISSFISVTPAAIDNHSKTREST